MGWVEQNPEQPSVLKMIFYRRIRPNLAVCYLKMSIVK